MQWRRWLAPAWARRLAGSPWFAALTAAAAAIVGLLGSVYQLEIASAFPLILFGPFQGWSWRSVFFWTALGWLAWLVFLRQVADDEIRERLMVTTESAEGTSKRIENIVRTLPPAGFQAHLTRLVEKSYQVLCEGMPRRLSEELPGDGLAAVIRALLNGLASLALAYDAQPIVDGRSAVYCANVMVFVPETLVRQRQLRLNFMPPEYGSAGLAGALMLRRDLSSTTQSSPGEADQEVPEIILPVPEKAERGGRWVAMPGAPRAFLTGEVDGYENTEQFADHCRRRGDFPPSVIEELHRYFSEPHGAHIKSFISRRLSYRGQSIGVLNIHANRRNLLAPDIEKRETFQALATPLIQDLTDAVAALLQSEGVLPAEPGLGTILRG